MGEKKWVKIEGTKVGADGTGYFRQPDQMTEELLENF